MLLRGKFLWKSLFSFLILNVNKQGQTVYMSEVINDQYGNKQTDK